MTTTKEKPADLENLADDDTGERRCNNPDCPQCNPSAASDHLCPRCGSQLVDFATPADQTSTPGRIDRRKCSSKACNFWVSLPELERLNRRAELRRRQTSTPAVELKAVSHPESALSTAELVEISHMSAFSAQEIRLSHDYLKVMLEGAVQLATMLNYSLDHAAHTLGHVAVNEILNPPTLNSPLHLAELGMVRDQIAAKIKKIRFDFAFETDIEPRERERMAGAWLELQGVLSDQIDPMLEGWRKNEPQSRAAEILLNGEELDP